MLSEIKKVKDRNKTLLMSFPNVVSLGIGPKMRGGVSTGTIAIKVFVSNKIPSSDLPKDQCVPEQIEGFETDVEEMEHLRAR